MKLQVLGGGNNQINAIKKAKGLGHEVILTDYLEAPPGRSFADIHEKVSTFDWEANWSVAKKYKVDGIMTTGTDQPVWTVAKVANALGLPAFLDVETATKVTNKRVMKDLFVEHGIPTVPFVYITKDPSMEELDKVTYPAVLKPLDSQGQRGVFRVESKEQVLENIQETLSYSKEKEALLESFYVSDEVTISGWVQGGETAILTMTDRKTFARGKHIGICYAHEYPSKHQEKYLEEAARWTRTIQERFGIKNGPIYVQMLIGEKGLMVNEVACRIGGAYEEVFIPWITGFDLLERVIQFSLTGKTGEAPILHRRKCVVSTQLFFAEAGKVRKAGNLEEIRRLPGMLDAGYNVRVGDVLGTIENATARAGYMVLEAEGPEELDRRLEAAYKKMGLWNEKMENLVIPLKRQRGDGK